MGAGHFLAGRTNKFLVAAAGSFSVFQIWWLVMMALNFRGGVSGEQGKGFAIDCRSGSWACSIGRCHFSESVQK